MENKLLKYFSGMSGLLLPVPNKSFYPPEFQDRSRLFYYGTLMNSIEINSSFYKIPQAATIAKWSGEVPADFKFTFKLFKEITHQKNLVFDATEVGRFFNVINHVEQKKGCVLVQLPPSIKISHYVQIRQLLEVLRNYDPELEWNIAIEFRHVSLYVEELNELLAEFEMNSVIHDKKFSPSPLEANNAPFVYLRFHGPGGDYRGSYDDSLLAEYASYINEWIDEGKSVYTYFNNTMGDANGNLDTLRSMVKKGSLSNDDN